MRNCTYYLGISMLVFWLGVNGLLAQVLTLSHVASFSGTNGPYLDGASSIYVKGNYAFVASSASNAFEVIDVTTPNIVHKTALFLTGPYKVTVQGNYAYLLCNNTTSGVYSLEIIDISNPLTPVHVGSLGNGQGGAALGGATRLAVVGNYAYLIFNWGPVPVKGWGIEVIDISNPANPVHKTALYDGDSGAHLWLPSDITVSVKGTSVVAYITAVDVNNNGFFQVMDMTNPTLPILKASLPNANGIQKIVGNYAYLASGTAFQVVDISDLLNPLLVLNSPNFFKHYVPFDAVDLQGDNQFLYSASAGYFETIDITNPSLPVKAGTLYGELDNPSCIFISGGFAYVTNYSSYQKPFLGNIEVLDLSYPPIPVVAWKLVNGFQLLGPRSTTVSGNYAYTVTNSGRFEIADISTANAPKHVGSLSDGIGGAHLLYPKSICVSGKYAYIPSSTIKNPSVSMATNSIEILDVSDPSNPVHAGNIKDGAGGTKLNDAFFVCIAGNYAYVASYLSNALEVLDVSNPVIPVHVGSLTDGVGGAMLKGPVSVSISGNYAYVASYGSGALEIVDVTNPASPVHKGSIKNGDGGALLASPLSSCVKGNYAYVVGLSNSLEIVDVTNPMSPAHAGSITDGLGGALLKTGEFVQVMGNYAYVTSGASNSLEVVDISNPASPTHVTNILDGAGGAMLKHPQSICLSGTHAFVASTNSNALEILSIATPQPKILACTASSKHNTEVLLPITVKNFSTIVSSQFEVDWDPAVATFVDVEGFGLSGMDQSSFGVTQVSAGKLAVSWLEPSLSPQTLSDGSALFNIRFKLTGNYGASTAVTITNVELSQPGSPGYVPIANVTTQSGSVSIDPTIASSAKIQYVNNQPVSNVQVDMTGSATQTLSTDATGSYSFTLSPQALNETYTLTPSKLNDPNPTNGIDVADVTTIHRHILNIQPLTTLQQFVAADVNNSGTVSTIDLVFIQSLILNMTNNYPSGSLWTFMPAPFTLDPASPYTYPTTATVALSDLEAGPAPDFTAIKLGDVDFSRDNTQQGRVASGLQVTLDIRQEMTISDDGEERVVEIPMRAKNFSNLSGYQFTVTWDAGKLEYTGVTTQGTKATFGDHQTTQGKLTALWYEPSGKSASLTDGDELFTLQFKSKGGTYKDVNITGEVTPVVVIDHNLQPASATVTWSELEKEDFSKLTSFYPNPFSETVAIEFYTEQEEESFITITDALGKNVLSQWMVTDKGRNRITWDGKDTSGATQATGIYFVELTVGGKVMKGKVVKR